jgi:hypothetical protein
VCEEEFSDAGSFNSDYNDDFRTTKKPIF